MDSDYGVPRELSDLQKNRSLYKPELPPCLQVSLLQSRSQVTNCVLQICTHIYMHLLALYWFWCASYKLNRESNQGFMFKGFEYSVIRWDRKRNRSDICRSRVLWSIRFRFAFSRPLFASPFWLFWVCFRI